ncbi:MAG: futalosine hydrolase [Bacteroidetes bacterium]|nr:futalosine hydrolase [Bacteroidota bacterium]
MPKFLIVGATKFEIQPLLTYFKIPVHSPEGLFSTESGPDISALITGVGMVNTAFALGRYSHNLFDYIINAGVCGAINKDLKIGEIVNVTNDTLSEMGAEDDSEFIKYPDLNLPGTNYYENQVQIISSALNGLRKVSGITVNTVHGNEQSIAKVRRLYEADVETMEGAAFFRGCSRLSENYFQLRAVSNYVEKRDKSKWQMPLAIENLNSFLISLIEELEK